MKKITIYPKNKYLKFLLKQFVYPFFAFILTFFVLSHVVLLKMQKLTDIGNISVYVSDDYTLYRDSITAYSKYGIQRLRNKGIETPLKVNLCFCETDREYVLRSLFVGSSTAAQSRAPMHYSTFRPFGRDTMVVQDTVECGSYIDQIISHELTHIYEYECLGIVKSITKLFFEAWKCEGFAEYMANSSSLRVPLGVRMFMEGRYSDDALNINEAFFTNYFVGRLRTDYLLGYKHVPEDEYWDTDYDVAKLDEEIRQALKSGDYQIFRQNDYE